MLYLIDCNGIIHRMFHGLPPMARESDGHPVSVAQGCASAFWRLVKQHPSHVAVVLDGKGGCAVRKALSSAYKANRPPMKPELACQMQFGRRAAEAFGFRVVQMDGVEADDLIATHTRLARQAGLDVCIMSSDKDLMQLVAPGVMMFDLLKNRPIMEADVEKKFGVPPHMVGDFLAMKGDTADGILGVVGVGDVWAAKLLNQYGDLERVLEMAHEIKGKIGECIRRDTEQARLARRLVTLNMHLDVEHTHSDFAYGEFDTRAVLDFLDECELVTLRNEIATGMMQAA